MLIALWPWQWSEPDLRWWSGLPEPASAMFFYENGFTHSDLHCQNAPWRNVCTWRKEKGEENLELKYCEASQELGGWPRGESV